VAVPRAIRWARASRSWGAPPGAACWSGAAPRPLRATGVSGPSRPRRSQGRAEGPASTHERAAALDSGAGKGWEPVQQANGRGRRVQGPAGQRSMKAVVRPARTSNLIRDKPTAALECRSRTAQVSLRSVDDGTRTTGPAPASASRPRGPGVRGRLMLLFRVNCWLGTTASAGSMRSSGKAAGCTCTSAPAGTARRDAIGSGGRCLDRRRPVALAGLDPVAGTLQRPPRAAPGHRLGAVGRTSCIVTGGHPKAAAWLG
jgi:hypothetical protein